MFIVVCAENKSKMMNILKTTITLCLIGNQSIVNAFSISSPSLTSTTASVASPSREATETDREVFLPEESDEDIDDADVVRYNDDPLEYYEDSMESREPDDPFHILLLDSTFMKNEQVTRSYVSGCITYVLGCPEGDAVELTNMAAVNGLSCLGTWEREECLVLGRKLQVRDLVVRVVPYCEGSNKSWQAKDSEDEGGIIRDDSSSFV